MSTFIIAHICQIETFSKINIFWGCLTLRGLSTTGEIEVSIVLYSVFTLNHAQCKSIVAQIINSHIV